MTVGTSLPRLCILQVEALPEHCLSADRHIEHESEWQHRAESALCYLADDSQAHLHSRALPHPLAILCLCIFARYAADLR